MNIHTHQKSIADLLQEGTRVSAGKSAKTKKTHYPGVYIISRTKVYDIFKLGEAHGNGGGLYDRIIHQYKICYSLKSSEFFLRYLVICPRKKEGKLHYSQIMEKEMLKIIDSKVEDSYSKEYLFAPKIDELESRLFEVLKSKSGYYTTAIKFFTRGFRTYTPEKGFTTDLLNFDSLPNLNPDVNLLLNLRKPQQAKTAKKIVYNMKKHTKPL